MKKHFGRIIKADMLINIFLIFATVIIGVHILSENLIDYESVNQKTIFLRFILQVSSGISIVILSASLSTSINKFFYKKLTISYIIYSVISYLLLYTQNLNNEQFKFFEFVKNKFFEIRGIGLLAIFIALAILLNYLSERFDRLKKYQAYFNYRGSSTVILSLLVSLTVLQDTKLIDKLKQFLFLTNAVSAKSFYVYLLYKLFIILTFTALVTYFFWKSVEGIRKNRPGFSLAIISSLFFSLIFNCTIQFGIRAEEDYLGEYIFSGATLFQIIILSLLFIFLFFIINRYWLATLIIIFTGTAFSIANYLKFSLRSEPLLITDLSMITQIDLIFSFLDIKILLFSIFLVFLLVVVYILLNNRFLKGRIIISIRKQFVLIFLTFSILSGIYGIFKHQDNGYISNGIPVLSKINNGKNITFEGHARSARYQSLMFVWMKQLTRTLMEKPENYSRKTIEDLVTKYQNRAEEINSTREQNISDETVIFILSESLANPNRIEGVTLTEDILKNIDMIKTTTTSGLMKSDNYGGGTANMESQALIGLPFYNLSNSISIYNVEVVPKMSIIPSISDSYLKQNKYVIHLGGTQLYSRADVYRRLNFGTFIATDSNATEPTVYEKYGGYPSDESTYQNILDQIDVSQSQFFSVITYQNHIPWTIDEPEYITGSGIGFSDLENSRLTNYARLVYKTDIVTKEFLDKLSKIDKDITVVFYGDHLPGLYPVSAFENDPENQYLTDYFIWSNDSNTKLEFPIVNSTDLPAALLAHTNSKVSPYYALLTDVLENASVDKNALTNEQLEIATDLKLVEYDLISGKSYLKNYSYFFQVQ
ncbi:LTA synthase family protein [Streptococcus suis]|nr:LTA synthase family protein [Streptococcus suis]